MSGLIEALDHPITGLDVVIIFLAWQAGRVLLALVGALAGLMIGRHHSTDGGAERRRIEAQDAALRAQAAHYRQADR